MLRYGNALLEGADLAVEAAAGEGLVTLRVGIILEVAVRRVEAGGEAAAAHEQQVRAASGQAAAVAIDEVTGFGFIAAFLNQQIPLAKWIHAVEGFRQERLAARPQVDQRPTAVGAFLDLHDSLAHRTDYRVAIPQ